MSKDIIMKHDINGKKLYLEKSIFSFNFNSKEYGRLKLIGIFVSNDKEPLINIQHDLRCPEIDTLKYNEKQMDTFKLINNIITDKNKGKKKMIDKTKKYHKRISLNSMPISDIDLLDRDLKNLGFVGKYKINHYQTSIEMIITDRDLHKFMTRIRKTIYIKK